MALAGYNDKQLTGVSVDECKAACCAETAFACVSFDYHTADNKCDLSATAADAVGGLSIGADFDYYVLPVDLPGGTKFPLPGKTKFPSHFPSAFPSKFPTTFPNSKFPLSGGTKWPTKFPAKLPGGTKWPTKFPTKFPVTSKYPTKFPTAFPTRFPLPGRTKYPLPGNSRFPTTFPSQWPGTSSFDMLVVDDEETGAGKQEAKGAATSSSGYELTTGWYVAIAITLFVFAVLVLSCKNNSSAAAPQRKDTVLARM